MSQRFADLLVLFLYILPEALRGFANYRMLIYAIVLILVMLTTNNPMLKNLIDKLQEGKRGKESSTNG